MEGKAPKHNESGGGEQGGRRRLGWWVTLLIMLHIRDHPDQQAARTTGNRRYERQRRLSQESAHSNAEMRFRFPMHIRFFGPSRNKVVPTPNATPAPMSSSQFMKTQPIEDPTPSERNSADNVLSDEVITLPSTSLKTLEEHVEQNCTDPDLAMEDEFNFYPNKYEYDEQPKPADIEPNADAIEPLELKSNSSYLSDLVSPSEIYAGSSLITIDGYDEIENDSDLPNADELDLPVDEIQDEEDSSDTDVMADSIQINSNSLTDIPPISEYATTSDNDDALGENECHDKSMQDLEQSDLNVETNDDAVSSAGTYAVDQPVFKACFLENMSDYYHPDDEVEELAPEDPLLPPKLSCIEATRRVRIWVEQTRTLTLNPENINDNSFPKLFSTLSLSRQPTQDPDTHKAMHSLITFSFVPSDCLSDSTLDSEYMEGIDAILKDLEDAEEDSENERINNLNHVPSLSGESSSDEDSMIGDSALGQSNEIPTSVLPESSEVDICFEVVVLDQGIMDPELDAASNGSWSSSSSQDSGLSVCSVVFEHMANAPDRFKSEYSSSESETNALSDYSDVLSMESLPEDPVPEVKEVTPTFDQYIGLTTQIGTMAPAETDSEDEGQFENSTEDEPVHLEMIQPIDTEPLPEVPLFLAFTLDKQSEHGEVAWADNCTDNNTSETTAVDGKGDEKQKVVKKRKGLLGYVNRRCRRFARAVGSLTNIAAPDERDRAEQEPVSSNKKDDGNAGRQDSNLDRTGIQDAKVTDENPSSLVDLADDDNGAAAPITTKDNMDGNGEDEKSKKKKGLLGYMNRRCGRIVRAIGSLTNMKDSTVLTVEGEPMGSNEKVEGEMGVVCENPKPVKMGNDANSAGKVSNAEKMGNARYKQSKKKVKEKSVINCACPSAACKFKVNWEYELSDLKFL